MKSRADAERIAACTGAACWHSKLDDIVKSKSLMDFQSGSKKLVTTYGLGVGMNLKVCSPNPDSGVCFLIFHQVRGQPIATVDILDVPWSASCSVQVCKSCDMYICVQWG